DATLSRRMLLSANVTMQCPRSWPVQRGRPAALSVPSSALTQLSGWPRDDDEDGDAAERDEDLLPSASGGEAKSLSVSTQLDVHTLGRGGLVCPPVSASVRHSYQRRAEGRHLRAAPFIPLCASPGRLPRRMGPLPDGEAGKPPTATVADRKSRACRSNVGAGSTPHQDAEIPADARRARGRSSGRAARGTERSRRMRRGEVGGEGYAAPALSRSRGERRLTATDTFGGPGRGAIPRPRASGGPSADPPSRPAEGVRRYSSAAVAGRRNRSSSCGSGLRAARLLEDELSGSPERIPSRKGAGSGGLGPRGRDFKVSPEGLPERSRGGRGQRLGARRRGGLRSLTGGAVGEERSRDPGRRRRRWGGAEGGRQTGHPRMDSGAGRPGRGVPRFWDSTKFGATPESVLFREDPGRRRNRGDRSTGRDRRFRGGTSRSANERPAVSAAAAEKSATANRVRGDVRLRPYRPPRIRRVIMLRVPRASARRVEDTPHSDPRRDPTAERQASPRKLGCGCDNQPSETRRVITLPMDVRLSPRPLRSPLTGRVETAKTHPPPVRWRTASQVFIRSPGGGMERRASPYAPSRRGAAASRMNRWSSYGR
ncbi:hypothetical protein THAOC_35688, partial [Thalassiosira oceanica]